ncbi:MAG: FMN-binding negative transcriptional regulator [Mycobacteriales bacterium]
MLVHPWDAARDEREWRDFVTAQGFGHLIATGRDRAYPVVVPTQFSLVGDEVWLHLARPNPVWAALAERAAATLSIAGDWSYIPSDWNADPSAPARTGVPTTYYGAVQLHGEVTVVDDADGKVQILRRQLAGLQAHVPMDDPTTHPRLLPGIRGIRLAVLDVRAKFKYGGNKTAGVRRGIATRLSERRGPGDASARAHLLERLAAEPAPTAIRDPAADTDRPIR